MVGGGELRGLSSAWRFLHYTDGDHHGVHMDGREPRNPFFDHEIGQYVQSRITLQLYLNSQGSSENQFQGGSTTFYKVVGRNEDGNFKFESTYQYQPRKGDCLIWLQEEPAFELDNVPQLSQEGYQRYNSWHTGDEVVSGHKYVARTVINYNFLIKEDAVDSKSVVWLKH